MSKPKIISIALDSVACGMMYCSRVGYLLFIFVSHANGATAEAFRSVFVVALSFLIERFIVKSLLT